MIKFINRLTNTEMRVADERKEAYLAAGHKLAAICEKPAEVEVAEPTEKKEVKPARARKKK